MQTITIDDETYNGMKARAEVENLSLGQLLKRTFGGVQPHEDRNQARELTDEEWQNRAQQFQDLVRSRTSGDKSLLTKEEALRRAAAIREAAASMKPLNPNADFSRDAIYD